MLKTSWLVMSHPCFSSHWYRRELRINGIMEQPLPRPLVHRPYPTCVDALIRFESSNATMRLFCLSTCFYALSFLPLNANSFWSILYWGPQGNRRRALIRWIPSRKNVKLLISFPQIACHRWHPFATKNTPYLFDKQYHDILHWVYSTKRHN